MPARKVTIIAGDDRVALCSLHIYILAIPLAHTGSARVGENQSPGPA